MEHENQALNFDEAAEAAKTALEAPEQNVTSDTNENTSMEEPNAEQPAEAQEQQQMTEQALNAAEQLAGRAEEQNAELLDVREQLAAVMQQNQSMQEMIRQMSQQQEEHVEQDMQQEERHFPLLDFDRLSFADDDEKAKINTNYIKQVEDYVAHEIEQRMSQIQPFLDEARDGAKQREKERVISEMKELPEFSGIETMSSQLDRIIGNSSLSRDDVPAEEKYAMAYAIARGVNAINNPPKPPAEPTTEELMNYYLNNQDFRDMVERKRVEEISKSQQVPPMSASSGAVNAALNIKKKPQTFDEALERSRKEMD